jgi:hypothetical protein
VGLNWILSSRKLGLLPLNLLLEKIRLIVGIKWIISVKKSDLLWGLNGSLSLKKLDLFWD